MKYFFVLLLSIPFFAYSQIDTVDNGNVEVIDTSSNSKTVFPFKNRMVEGPVEVFDLDSNRLLATGSCQENLRQGIWYTFSYDSSGVPDTTSLYTYVNDTLEGPFMEMLDSMRTSGNYKANKLQGSYKREYWIPADSGMVSWIPIDSGQYADSVPYGQWTYFVDGRLYQTGFYEEGVKSQNWITYDIYEKGSKNIIMREAHFYEGRKTGNEKIHFRYEINDNEEGGRDTVKIQEFEQVPWQNGKLIGTYYKQNKKGETLIKGTYSDGKKVSTWEYYNPKTKWKEIKTLLNDTLNGPYTKMTGDVKLEEGTYALGEKNKMWKYFNKKGVLLHEETYENGIKSGEWKYYKNGEQLTLTMIYEENKVIQISKYNDMEVDVLNMDIRYNENNVEIICEEIFEDSLLTRTMLYSIDSNGLEAESFMMTFDTANTDTSLFVLHGGYTIKKDGHLEVSGEYKYNMQDGNWDYFYNSAITWRKIYTDGILSKENFIDKLSGELLGKGEYVLWYGPERPKLEFKIKEGLRNGKSTWYMKNGNVLREEKYKEGILQ